MSVDLGTELPQRSSLVWLLLGTAVLFAVPVARMVRRALRERGVPTVLLAWGTTAAVLATVVVAPVAMAVHLHRRHTWVGEEAVTRTRGDVVVERLRLADLDEVRVRHDGGLGAATPEELNDVVELVGTDDTGRLRTMRVSRVWVTTLEPLLHRLAEEVERRPDLLRDEEERRLFDGALAEAGVAPLSAARTARR